jgi:selenocysteine lyase/cysteine desulfurase
LTYAQERLREINSLRLIGTARAKGPVISFEMKGAHPHDVATVIDRSGDRGARRHPLRDAAFRAVQCDGDVPRLVRNV